MERKKLNIWTGSSFFIFLTYLVFLVYPIVTVLKQALVNEGSFSLENFVTFFSKSYYSETLINSFKVSVTATITSVVVGTLLAYLFSMKRRNDAIIPTPYFANFYADFFIDYIANPEKLEKSRQLKVYREEAEQYFAEKEYQRLLNTLERIQKEDLLSLYAMSDYYFLSVDRQITKYERYG